MNLDLRILLLRAGCSIGFLVSLAFCVSIAGTANQRIPQITSQDVPIIQEGGFSSTLAGIQRGRGTLMGASAFFFLVSAGCLSGALYPYKQRKREAIGLLPPSLQSSNPEAHPQAAQLQAAIPANPTTADEQRQADLWQLIQTHEEGWIGKLINCPALLIFGDQGAGKTTTAASIGLIRKLFGSHDLKVYDPHGHQNADKWHSCEVVGGQWNYSEISQGLKDYFNGLRYRTQQSQPISRIWDELTNYAERLKCDQIGEFLPSALSDARKARDFQILISHGPDLGVLGCPKRSGSHGMKQRGLVQLRLLSQLSAIGEPFPAMRGILSGLFRDEQGKSIDLPITIPGWLNPQQLIGWFPELDYKISPQMAGGLKARVYTPATQPEAASSHPNLERVWDISSRLDEFFHSGYGSGDKSGDTPGDRPGTGRGQPEINAPSTKPVDFWVQGTWEKFFEMGEAELFACVKGVIAAKLQRSATSPKRLL